MFSSDMCHIFILTTVSFAEEKFLILSLFSFLDYAFVVIFKNSPPNPRSLRFSPVLSSWKFIALHFTFSSMIHFKIIFCKIWSKFRVRCEVCDKVCIFAYVCQMVQHHLLKELLYLHQNAFAPLLKTNWPIYM